VSLERWRRRIDVLDGELVRLLNRRARAVSAIADWKKGKGVPVHDPRRERAVLRRARRANAGPLDDATLVRMFERLIDEFRGFERARMERR
jgi:chorismate mutase